MPVGGVGQKWEGVILFLLGFLGECEANQVVRVCVPFNQFKTGSIQKSFGHVAVVFCADFGTDLFPLFEVNL